MGPSELMDLIDHDTNFSVTLSVYEANFFDKRFVPSLVQRELVDGAQLRLTDGRTASQIGVEVTVFDLSLNADRGGTLAWTASAARWLGALGFTPQRIADAVQQSNTSLRKTP
jgi:3-hydroxyacyl-CoA dehydrogenase